MPVFLRVIALMLFLPLPAVAREAAMLVADRVEIRGDNVLVAEGAVEVFYQGMRLQAARVAFDQEANRLTIEGPLVLTDAGGTRLIADQAELSSDLTEGILTGARLVLDQQLQLAADEMLRVGGRYTELGRTVASSCRVCAGSPVPLWEIRARRVVRDEQEGLIYFEHAQLRVGGLPIAYIPRLRLPEPGNDRVSGFLPPRFRTTSELGTGVYLPYFLTLGPSRDLTITPYLSSRDAQTLGLRYRQAFRTGTIEVEGAISQDEILPGETRGYLFAEGSFLLGDRVKLAFGIQGTTDNSYLLDYGISEQDVLDSFVSAEQVQRDSLLLGRAHYYQSLRDSDDDTILPSTLIDLVGLRRYEAPLVGGTVQLRYQALARNRTSDRIEDTNDDGTADGQDLARGLVGLDWRNSWVLPGGVVATGLGAAQGDVTFVRQDPQYPASIERLYGAVGAELRWPLARGAADGSTQVLEPVAQLVLAPSTSEDVPDEDSLLVEFDNGNLLSLNRFPGTDAVELGNRLALGLTWTRFGAEGSTLGFGIGRVYREQDLDQFSATSGLDGSRSDWLISARLASPDGLSLSQRLLLDDDFSATLAETTLNWATPRIGLSSGYVWSIADPAIELDDPISELALNGSWKMARNWTGRVGLRQDFEAGRASQASIGLEYRNECLLVDVSLSRWFADSTSLTPTTEFGLGIDLLGFGGGPAPGPVRQCRG